MRAFSRVFTQPGSFALGTDRQLLGLSGQAHGRQRRNGTMGGHSALRFSIRVKKPENIWHNTRSIHWRSTHRPGLAAGCLGICGRCMAAAARPVRRRRAVVGRRAVAIDALAIEAAVDLAWWRLAALYQFPLALLTSAIATDWLNQTPQPPGFRIGWHRRSECGYGHKNQQNSGRQKPAAMHAIPQPYLYCHGRRSPLPTGKPEPQVR
jgi:hypothetical protein